LGQFECPADSFYRTEKNNDAATLEQCCQASCGDGWVIHLSSAGRPTAQDVDEWAGHQLHIRDCVTGAPLHTDRDSRASSIPIVSSANGASETDVCIAAPASGGVMIEMANGVDGEGFAWTLRDAAGALRGWGGDVSLLAGDQDLAGESPVVPIAMDAGAPDLTVPVYSTCPVKTCADVDYQGSAFACPDAKPLFNFAAADSAGAFPGSPAGPSADDCCAETCADMGLTAYALTLVDSWGDGWNGASFQMSDCDGAALTPAYTFDTGDSADFTLCLATAASYAGDCHLIACGSTANGCSAEPPRCAPNAEEHEVSCCSATNVTPGDGVNDWVRNFRDTCDGDVWGLRRPSGRNGSCNHAATYDEAIAWCADLGGRLCTANEINTDCTRGSGCSHDADLMWTSDGGYTCNEFGNEFTVPAANDFWVSDCVGGLSDLVDYHVHVHDCCMDGGCGVILHSE
jgi:hypothetical protein